MDERTEKNREIALRLVKAVGSGDMPVVESLVHPDLDWWLNGMGHLDHDAFIASLHMLHSAKSGGFTVVTSTAEADRVVIEMRSEEHTSELQSLMRISYAVFCL